MKHQLSLFAVVILLPFWVSAQGNLVVNGGFDSTSVNEALGWTLTGGAFANVKNGNSAPDVVMGEDSTARQMISGLTPGAIYFVSGDYKCSGTDTTTISFQVALDGVSFFQTAVPINQNWNTFGFLYTATSSSAVLSLSQTYEEYLIVSTYSIDNIAMYAIPEPSALALILLCGGVFIHVRHNCKYR